MDQDTEGELNSNNFASAPEYFRFIELCMTYPEDEDLKSAYNTVTDLTLASNGDDSNNIIASAIVRDYLKRIV